MLMARGNFKTKSKVYMYFSLHIIIRMPIYCLCTLVKKKTRLQVLHSPRPSNLLYLLPTLILFWCLPWQVFALLFGQKLCSLIDCLLFTLTAFILNEIKKREHRKLGQHTLLLSIIKASVNAQWSIKFFLKAKESYAYAMQQSWTLGLPITINVIKKDCQLQLSDPY